MSAAAVSQSPSVFARAGIRAEAEPTTAAGYAAKTSELRSAVEHQARLNAEQQEVAHAAATRAPPPMPAAAGKDPSQAGDPREYAALVGGHVG